MNYLGTELANVEQAMEGDNGTDQQMIAMVGIQWIDLLLRKNRDYGCAVWKSPILDQKMSAKSAILVRMSDKIERLRTLIASDRPGEVAESLEDTMQDLGAYALLYCACPKSQETK